MFPNQFKLGRPIKEGTKVLLENRSKQLLKSQKLLNLRSGPYTVIEKKSRRLRTEFKMISHRQKNCPPQSYC